MIRPNPTKQLILDSLIIKEQNEPKTIGYHKHKISSLHHGLDNLPDLKHFYSHLNFEELLVFAMQSWIQRDNNMTELSDKIKSCNPHTIYPIFNYMNSKGFSDYRKMDKTREFLLANHKHDLNQTYDLLNPFKGKHLMERLSRVDKKYIDALKEQILSTPPLYCLEGQQRRVKKGIRDLQNPPQVKVMTFQPVYKNNRLIDNYASEIAKIISSFGNEFIEFKIPESRTLF